MEKYKRALNRNLNEMRKAWFEWRTLIAIESVHHPFPDASFFDVVHSALFNDALGHLMKVLDHHPNSASFWFIYKQKKDEIDAQRGNDKRIKRLESLAKPDRLKHIRDKTHFHIDEKAVINPEQVWSDANITSKEVNDALLDLIRILQTLQVKEFGDKFPMDYDENQATHLAKIAKDLI